MTVLEWDKIGERFFETGVSHGVLYPENAPGVAWNGLISVEDSSTDEIEPVFFDGQKINDILTSGDFTGVLKAYTYPDEFLECEGTVEFQEGVFITNQPHTTFGLSYRTNIGNDLDGPYHGYKLHLLYNITAVPAPKEYQTLALDVTPNEFEWQISAIPEDIDFFRHSAHLIFDSTKIDPYLLADIEDILYGSEDNDPHLPSMKSLGGFISSWARLVITDHGDGTWSAYSPVPGVIEMLGPDEFQITSDTATYLDADTYEISTSEKNDGDIWLP